MKKLVLETTAPFQGLAELVAYDEGLFEKEGLTIEWADREKGVDKTPQLHITNANHNEAPRFASHGRLLEQDSQQIVAIPGSSLAQDRFWSGVVHIRNRDEFLSPQAPAGQRSGRLFHVLLREMPDAESEEFH